MVTYDQLWQILFSVLYCSILLISHALKFLVNLFPCTVLQLQAYADDPETLTTNKLITQSYLECRKRGFAWQPTFHPHYYPGRPDLATYVPRPLPPPPSASRGDSGSGEEPTAGSHAPKSNM